MKNRRAGFTLVEVIVSLAIVGIIAAGIIPIFGMQYKMTLDTKNITSSVFDAQGEVENNIFLLKDALITASTTDEYAISGVSSTSAIIFGTTVPLYRLHDVFSSNENKSFTVFLSKILAINEVRPLLDATGVQIDVITTNPKSADNRTAYLDYTPKPTLLGLVTAFDTNSSWIVNVYKWYVSKEGSTNPVFPDDYVKIVQLGDPATHNNLSDLSKYANRYIEFTVTPVDINGIRGKETRSNAPVYIVGKEWRTGVFAWVDKDADVIYTTADVKVEKWNSGFWVLLEGFDSNEPFPDKVNNDVLLDPKLGSLYVPMGIDRNTNIVGPIVVQGVSSIVWTVDKSIHLATDVLVGNASNVQMQTDEGNIVLYQFVDINNVTGDAKDANNDGIADTINDGARVTTSQGSIVLQTTGRGNVILQDYTELDSGADVSLIPFGNISMTNNVIKAKGKIVLDTTKGLSFPGNRDILLQGTDFVGNSTDGTASIVEIFSNDEVTLTDVDITNSEVRLVDNATMLGGKLLGNSTIKVANGKILTLGFEGTSPVDNTNGSFNLGDTGGIAFVHQMSSDLKEKLNINLYKGVANNQVSILTDYGRNIGYADTGSTTVNPANFGTYQNIGTGSTNLEFTILKKSDGVDSNISFNFNEDKVIELEADGVGPISTYYTLRVRDKFTEDVVGNIIFNVSALSGESPVVEVIGPDMPKRIVTFFKTFGDTEPYATINVEVGTEIGGLMPADPDKVGWQFISWKTLLGEVVNSFNKIIDNITAYGEWSQKQALTGIGPITGTLRVGNTLTAGNLTPTGATATYQWQRSDSVNGTYINITNAVTTSYTLSADDLSKYIRVSAEGTGSFTGTVYSEAVSVAKIQLNGIGTIIGTPQVGSTLTAGTLTPTGATANYQWKSSSSANGTYNDITGATSSTYTLVAGDLGKYIRVYASGTGNYTGTVNSDPITVIQTVKILIIVANNPNDYITITSNYGDVVTNNTAAIIQSSGSWVNLSNNLQVRITTTFPNNMDSLTLTPNPSDNTVTITGREGNKQNIATTELTVVVRDKTTTTITKTFTVEVSGTNGSRDITIGTITVQN